MSNKSSESEIPGGGDRTIDAAWPVSRRERKRAETRERLFSASMRLLSEYEFDAVTVEMITEAADVGKGTFFNYFSNKEAILSYYFENQLRMLTETLQVVGAPQPEQPEIGQYDAREGGPFWRRIIAIVHESAARRHKEKHLTRTLLSIALTNPQVRAANIEFRGRIIEVICGLIVDAQRHRELRSDVPADMLAAFMFGTYLGALYMWSQSDTGESLHEAIDKAYSRVWSGIRDDGSLAHGSPAEMDRQTCAREPGDAFG
jgi:AcrR family transcriptional regulator